MKKYLDLTIEEPVIIQRGRTETFVLTRQDQLPKLDLSNALTKDEIVKRIKSDIKQMFANGKR
jgi:hypothetical protein